MKVSNHFALSEEAVGSKLFQRGEWCGEKMKLTQIQTGVLHVSIELFFLFLYENTMYMVWILNASVSVRHFWEVPTTYVVFVEI